MSQHVTERSIDTLHHSVMTVRIRVIFPRDGELPVLGGGWVRPGRPLALLLGVERAGGPGLTSIRLSAGQGHTGESEELMEGAALWRGPLHAGPWADLGLLWPLPKPKATASLWTLGAPSLGIRTRSHLAVSALSCWCPGFPGCLGAAPRVGAALRSIGCLACRGPC